MDQANNNRNQMDDITKGLLIITQLEDTSGKINEACKEILRISSNPISIMLEGNNVKTHINNIIINVAILNNFLEALNKVNKGDKDENN